MRWPRGLQEWAGVAGIAGVILSALVVLGGIVGNPFKDEQSPEAFIADADAVCKETNAKTAQLPLTGRPEQVKTNAELWKTIKADGLSMMRALEPPDSMRVGFNQYVAYLAHTLELRVELLDAVVTGNAKKIEAARKPWAHAYERSSAAARALGLTFCGRGG